MDMVTDENIRYQKFKKLLDDWEVSIVFEFYENFSDFLEKDYNKKWLEKAKSNDEKLMTYVQLLAIFTSITLAKIRRLIEEKIIDYDHETFENFILSSTNDKKMNKIEDSAHQNPENYEF